MRGCEALMVIACSISSQLRLCRRSLGGVEEGEP
jgi:hypothetical protein